MLIFRESKERLNENSFDRKVNSYIKDYTGLEDFNQVRSFLLDKIYKVIPEIRLISRPEAVKTIMEWFLNPDGTTKNNDDIDEVRQILQTVKKKSPQELDKIGYSMQFFEPKSFISNFSHLLKFEKNVVPPSQSKKEYVTPNGYHVKRIDSFNEAYESAMREWCIGRDEEWWDEFIGYTSTIYLLWNDDIDNTNMGTVLITDEDGEEYETTYDEYFMDMSYTKALRDKNFGTFGSGRFPYDVYGLSKLLVISHENGMQEVWSRYNMQEGKDGTYLSMSQLSELIGTDAKKAFPYVDFNIKEAKNNKTIRLTESQLRRYIKEAIDSYSGKEAFTVGQRQP